MPDHPRDGVFSVLSSFFSKHISGLHTFFWPRDRGVISTSFSWGQIFFISQSHRTIEKLEKKHHYICSNLTLFIVPFFLSFSSLFYFLSFLSFLFSFFLFSFLWGGGRRPPQPPQMTPLPRDVLLSETAWH